MKRRGYEQEFWPDRSRSGSASTSSSVLYPATWEQDHPPGPPAIRHLSPYRPPPPALFMATRPCRAAPPWSGAAGAGSPINSVAFHGVSRRPDTSLPFPFPRHRARAVVAVRAVAGSDTPRSPHARVGAALPARPVHLHPSPT